MANRRDRNWIWVDPNYDNLQNQTLLKTLHILHIKVWPVKSYKDLLKQIRQIQKTSEEQTIEISVICASSLPNSQYFKMIENVLINEIVIYCFHIERGLKCMKKFQRINKVINKDHKLINYIYSGID